MKLSLSLLLSVVLLLANVPVSMQYGIIFADTVLPVKEGSTTISDTTSEHISTTTMNIDSLSLSDPRGFNVNVENVLNIASSELNLNGELGFAFGGKDTESTNLSVDGDIGFQSQEFFALFSSINFSIPEIEELDTSIEFDSARYVSIFADDKIDIDGRSQLSVQSTHGNVDVFAPNILGSANDIPIIADESIHISSRTGFVDLTSKEGFYTHADTIQLNSEQATEMVADVNLEVIAEDSIKMNSGSHHISALGSVTLTSERSVDISSPSGFFVDAEDIYFSAGGAFYLKSSEEAVSQVSAVAGNRLDIRAPGSAFFASKQVNFEASGSMSVIADIMDFTSMGSSYIGSEATDSIRFTAGTDNSLLFSLENATGLGAPFLFDSTMSDFVISDDFTLDGTDVSIASGTATINALNNVSFRSGDILFESSSDQGSFSLTTISGQDFSALDIEIGAHAQYLASPEIQILTQRYTASDIGFTYLQADDISLFSSGDFIFNSDSATLTGDSFSFTPSGSGAPLFSATAQDQEFFVGDSQFTSTATSVISSDVGSLDFLIEGSYLATAITNFSIHALLDAAFTFHGDFTTSADVITISNPIQDDDDDFISLAFHDDIQFIADFFDLQATTDILFEAGMDIDIKNSGAIDFTADEFSITSILGAPVGGGGISLSSDTFILAESGNSTNFGAFNIYLSATTYNFDASLLGLQGTEEIEVTGNNINLEVNDSISAVSNGHIFFDSGEQIVLTVDNFVAGAKDSFNMTASVMNWNAMSASLSSSQITLDAQNFVVDAGYLHVNSIVQEYFSFNGISIASVGNIDVASSGEIVLQTDDSHLFSAGTTLLVNSTDIHVSATTFSSLVAGDYSMEASAISFTSEQPKNLFSLSSVGAASLLAQKAVYITSDDYITMTSSGPYQASAADELFISSDDSIVYTALSTISLDSTSDADLFDIQSGGASRFRAMEGDALLSSGDNIDIVAGRVVMDTWSTDVGALLTADVGSIEIQSMWGSVRVESGDAMLLNATNPDTSASTFFTSTNGVSMKTENGGYFFDSQGLLPGGNLSFDFATSGIFADIVIDTRLGPMFTNVLNDITYMAGQDISLSAAFGASFTPEDSMIVTVPAGQLDINAERGITINAGRGLDTADISFTQENGSFLAAVYNQISLHSTGAVPNESILVSGQSDIRFATANTGDISFIANEALSFTATGSFYSHASNNIHVDSSGGVLSFTSVSDGDFVTESGPIFIQSFSSGPGGAIDFLAETGEATFVSGNSTHITALQTVSFNAETGLDISSIDGSIDLEASSAGSFIHLITAGGLFVSSFGNNVSPDDGIVLQAANNIEIGTADTFSIAFNAVDRVVVGTFSRPIITFNAGGSFEELGMTVNSDGGIIAETESSYTAAVGSNLLIDTQTGIASLSGGDATFTTIGTQGISFSAVTGTNAIHGDVQNRITSNEQLIGSSSGSLRIIGSGDAVDASVNLVAEAVTLSSGTHQWNVGTLDADLTNSFTLNVAGDGLFDGRLDHGSTITFKANDFFSATSNGVLSISTDFENGPILFDTLAAGSDINLQTDPSTSIEWNAGREIGVFADSFDFTSDRMTFSASDSDPNDNGESGDIEIGAEDSVVASAVGTISGAGELFILIETTGTEDDIGGPLSLIAGGDMTVSASRSSVIQNIPHQGGSLDFAALSSITITNVPIVPDSGVEKTVSFLADGEFMQSSTRNNVRTASSAELTVGEDFSVLVDGVDSNDAFGVQLEATSTNGIHFESIFGSIHFDAAADVLVDSLVSVDIFSDQGGVIEGSAFELEAADSISFTATRSAIEIAAEDGIEYISGSNIEIQSDGINDSSSYGILFESSGSSTQIEVVDTLDISPLGMRAKTIDLVTDTDIIMSSQGDILVDVEEEIAVVADSIVFSASEEIIFESATFDVDCDGGIFFTGSSMTLETLGEDAAVSLTCSGGINMLELNTFDVQTERRLDADINIITPLAAITFTVGAPVDPNSGIDFVADHGDFVFLALSDDSDFYVDCAAAFLSAEQDVLISSISTETTIPGLSLSAASEFRATSTTTASFSSTDSITVQASRSVIFASDDREDPEYSTAEGGPTFIEADTLRIIGENVFLNSPQEGGEVIISSLTDNIEFTSDTLTLNEDAVMKIPSWTVTSSESNDDYIPYGECVEGSIFITNTLYYSYNYFNDENISYLCICPSDNSNARCVEFHTPPCDPRFDTNCLVPA